jgi:hypothetical protein
MLALKHALYYFNQYCILCRKMIKCCSEKLRKGKPGGLGGLEEVGCVTYFISIFAWNGH